jgi:hypothetical protein
MSKPHYVSPVLTTDDSLSFVWDGTEILSAEVVRADGEREPLIVFAGKAHSELGDSKGRRYQFKRVKDG